MKWLLLAFLAGVVTASGQDAPLVFEVAEIEKIREADGKQATVRGLIESTGKSRGSGINYLNFPGREFSAVIFAKNLKAFPDGEPADLLKGKLVEVSGKISIYKGEPQIVVDTPDQIVVIDPATQKPEETEVKGPEVEDKPEPEPVEENKEDEEPAAPDPGKVNPRDYFDDP